MVPQMTILATACQPRGARLSSGQLRMMARPAANKARPTFLSATAPHGPGKNLPLLMPLRVISLGTAWQFRAIGSLSAHRLLTLPFLRLSPLAAAKTHLLPRHQTR